MDSNTQPMRHDPAATRIAVVGAGAIGGYVGAMLADAGQDVTFIDAWPEHVEAIRKGGLQISEVSLTDRTIGKLNILHINDVQCLSVLPPFDIVLLSVKSYDTAWAMTMIAPYLAHDGYVVSLQNCINEETIAGIVGWGRTTGCITLIAAELYAPARIRRTVGRNWTTTKAFYVGEIHGRVSKRIQHLADILSLVDTVVVGTNLWGERWSKLCLNVMRNALSAATGLGGNARERDDRIRRFSIHLGGEAIMVGRALGYDFEHVGALDADKVFQASQGDAAALAAIEDILLAEAQTSGRSEAQRPSMAQDMAKGRRTEVDWINGFIVERAASIGLEAPFNAALTQVVHQIARGERKPLPENITGLSPRGILQW